MLRQSLDSNPRNQMAFEYLLAYYLLTGDFKRLAQQAGQLRDFSYLAVPRRLEEALLLGRQLHGLDYDLHGLEIRPETVQCFQNFNQALARIDVKAAAAFDALTPEYGDTLWHYYYARLALPRPVTR